MPRVSIIIPAYNASAYLRAALDSVIAQTFTNWEAIVIDDGSTDDTAQIVRASAPSFGGRLRYVYQKNRGLPGARNTGIRHASGDLIALLDSDDLWMEHRLAAGVAAMDRKPEVALVHARVVKINPQGAIVEHPSYPPHKYLSGHIAENILTRRAHLHCPTILFRKSCMDAVGFFDETLRATEDRDMWFRIAEKYQVAFLDQAVAFYRVSPNQMSSNFQRMITAQTQFIEKHVARGACTRWSARQAYAQIYRERGDALFNAKKLGESIPWYARSLRTYPFRLGNVYMFFRALAEPLVHLLRLSPLHRAQTLSK